MPRISPLALALLTAACTPPPSSGAPSTAVAAPVPYRCTEVIGLSITAEWFGAGFEQLVDDARFQARTRPHTFVDQWANPTHEAWTEPLTSPCTEGSANPDRVVLFAAKPTPTSCTPAPSWKPVTARYSKKAAPTSLPKEKRSSPNSSPALSNPPSRRPRRCDRPRSPTRRRSPCAFRRDGFVFARQQGRFVFARQQGASSSLANKALRLRSPVLPG